MPLLLVRHAWAGDRERWAGDDRLRPLDERGLAQAALLVGLLDRFAVDAIYSSPATRCVQTVDPLARARGLEIEERDELGEARQWDDGRPLVASLAVRDVVVCGHGGLQQFLLDPPKWHKGEVFVVSQRLTIVERLRPRLPKGPPGITAA